jgi:hypothetical protein
MRREFGLSKIRKMQPSENFWAMVDREGKGRGIDIDMIRFEQYRLNQKY